METNKWDTPFEEGGNLMRDGSHSVFSGDELKQADEGTYVSDSQHRDELGLA